MITHSATNHTTIVAEWVTITTALDGTPNDYSSGYETILPFVAEWVTIPTDLDGTPNDYSSGYETILPFVAEWVTIPTNWTKPRMITHPATNHTTFRSGMGDHSEWRQTH